MIKREERPLDRNQAIETQWSTVYGQSPHDIVLAM